MPDYEIGRRRDNDLADKVALVTGAARNIGRAIAVALANGGAKVVVNARTSISDAEETVALIKETGAAAEVAIADVSNPGDVDRMIAATIARFGRLDVLVNNAAVRRETPLLELSLDEWRDVFAATLDSTFLCTRAALPHMMAAGGGSIINIGGQTAHAPVAERAHVIAAKAGVAGFTRAVALEFAPHNVTCNCVVPAAIDTVRGLPGAPQRPPSRGLPPAGRRGSVWEIAAMVRLLAGPEGRYITGQTIHVNGGGFMP